MPQCKCKWWINIFMLGFLIFVGLISLQSNQVCFFRYLLLMSPISFKIFHLSIWELLLLSGEGFLLELQVHINLMPPVCAATGKYSSTSLNIPFISLSFLLPFTSSSFTHYFFITISVALFQILLHVVPMVLCTKTLSFTCNSLRCCGTIKCGNWGMLYLLSHHFISKYLHLSYICSFCLTQSLYSIAQQHLYIFTCVSVLQTLAHISVSLHTF